MLTITGEVRKVLDDTYTDKSSGKPVKQAILVIEPANQAQNHEIKLTAVQCKAGLDAEWQALVGHQAAIEVSLYVNFQYKFHRFTAVTGKPLLQGGKPGGPRAAGGRVG